MIPKTTETLEKCRVADQYAKELRGLPCGAFVVPGPTKDGPYLQVISSGTPTAADYVAMGLRPPLFEHVSVRAKDVERCPTWEEMCHVKDLFWRPDELVLQYHPPKSEYVNCHPFVLHLWRPLDVVIPLPDRKMI